MKGKEDKTVERYADGLTQFEEVIKGITEKNLDCCREEGKWTIRQILHLSLHLKQIKESLAKSN